MTQLVWLVVEIPGFQIVLTEEYAANVSAVTAKKKWGQVRNWHIFHFKKEKLQTVLAASSLYVSVDFLA